MKRYPLQIQRSTFLTVKNKFIVISVCMLFLLLAGCDASAIAATQPNTPDTSDAAKSSLAVAENEREPLAQEESVPLVKSCTGLGDAIRDNKLAGTAYTVGNYAARADVKAYAHKLATCYDLDLNWILKTLKAAQYQASSAKFIMPQAAGTRNWKKFVASFVQPARIQAGVKYWQSNLKWLEQAEATYGVPPKAILGILGVETIFGQYTGNFRIIDVLSTLSFDFPNGRSDRTDFFADELAKYMLFASQQKIDPFGINGSYAGAMGMPQFMPSSLLAYGIDFDGDGKIDLHESHADIIGSVANYLAMHGWQAGIPGSLNVSVIAASKKDLEYLRQPDIVPSFSILEMASHGVIVQNKSSVKMLSDEVKLSLVILENEPDGAPTYVAGTKNFFVITRYNRSSFYAMVVIELAQAIEKAYIKATQKNTI